VVREKILLLVRHAKSSHEIPFLEDKLRPLAPRGKTDSVLIGQNLLDLQLVADQVYCSSSVRTKSTLAILNQHLNISELAISYHDDLYTFNDCGDTYLKHLKESNNRSDIIMILSHNNSCVNVAEAVSDGNLYSFPTCAVLICRWKISEWSLVDWSNVNSYSMLTPKQLKSKRL